MQALTPAMEGWRKRIGRIAANFEAANKVPQQPAAPGQAQPQAQAGSSASQAPQQVGTGCLKGYMCLFQCDQGLNTRSVKLTGGDADGKLHIDLSNCVPVCISAACRDGQSLGLPLSTTCSAAPCPDKLRYVWLACEWYHTKAQMQCLLQQAEKPSKESKGKKQGNAYSGPHTVWDSITELGGEAAAAKGDRQIADALTQAIKQEGSGSQEEVAAALATQEMADAASGVMAEASRLASDIISAGKLAPQGSSLLKSSGA